MGCNMRQNRDDSPLLSSGLAIIIFILALMGLVSCNGSDSSAGGGVGVSDCPKGTLNCPCDSTGACESPLVCKEGFCVAGDHSDCRAGAGAEGCPCTAENGYESGLVCQDNVCTHIDCPPGTDGCPCDASGGCGDGLVCMDNVCHGASSEQRGSIGNKDVRACDVLLDIGSTPSSMSVVFASSVIGRYRREGAKLALSFTAKADSPLDGTVVQLVDHDGASMDAGSITPSLITCYDRSGVVVSEPDFSF